MSKPFLGAGYGAFCLEHQDITLELVLCEHGESFEVLEGGDVDIIMTAVLDMKDTQGYCFSYLYEDGFGALMHRSHRLAECGSLSLDDLTGERIGVMESRHSLMISPFVVNELEERGLGKPVRLPAADINSIPVVAAADVSNVVIVPLHLRLLYDNVEQVVVPLRDGRLKQTICMLWKPERESPALLDLVESMKREAARSVAERA